MARGAEEKQIVFDKIKEIFPDAFECDKVLRIPIGEVEIKVALTCAKDCVRGATTPSTVEVNEQAPATESIIVEPSQQELNNVATLMSALNF